MYDYDFFSIAFLNGNFSGLRACTRWKLPPLPTLWLVTIKLHLVIEVAKIRDFARCGPDKHDRRILLIKRPILGLIFHICNKALIFGSNYLLLPLPSLKFCWTWLFPESKIIYALNPNIFLGSSLGKYGLWKNWKESKWWQKSSLKIRDNSESCSIYCVEYKRVCRVCRFVLSIVTFL